MASPDIFLSYNRKDAVRAKQFADSLAAEGFEVWWDATLRSGENYDEVTETALRKAKAVVVLWSKRSVKSRWVRAEATVADQNGTLVPAMIEQCRRPVMFELKQTAELSHWHGDRTDAAWRSFVSDLRRQSGTCESDELHSSGGDPAATNAKSGFNASKRWVFAGAALLMLVAAGAVFLLVRSGESSRLTEQPIQIAAFPAEGGPEAALMGETVRSTAQDLLGISGFRSRSVAEPSGKIGLALKGSVIGSGGKLKVFIQIEHLPSGDIIWNGTFDDDASQVDRIATAASVAAVESLATIRDAEQQDGIRLEPRDLAMLIEGGNLTTVVQPLDSPRTSEIYQRLAARLPNSAYVQGMLADSLTFAAFRGPSGDRAKASKMREQAIDRAIAIDPALAEAAYYSRAAAVQRIRQYDPIAQEDAVLDGLAHAPDSAILAMRECEFLASVGRIDSGVTLCQRALAKNPTLAPVGWRTAFAEYLAGEDALALDAVDRAYRYHPDDAHGVLTKLGFLVLGAKPELALELLPEVRRLYPEFGDAEAAAFEAYVHALGSGSQTDADTAARQIVERYLNGALMTDHSIGMLVMLGHLDDAFTVLLAGEQTWSFPFPSRAYLFHSLLRSLRADPRFWQLAQRQGLINYWRKRDVWPDFCGKEMPLAICKKLAAQAATSQT